MSGQDFREQIEDARRRLEREGRVTPEARKGRFRRRDKPLKLRLRGEVVINERELLALLEILERLKEREDG